MDRFETDTALSAVVRLTKAVIASREDGAAYLEQWAKGELGFRCSIDERMGIVSIAFVNPSGVVEPLDAVFVSGAHRGRRVIDVAIEAASAPSGAH